MILVIHKVEVTNLLVRKETREALAPKIKIFEAQPQRFGLRADIRPSPIFRSLHYLALKISPNL